MAKSQKASSEKASSEKTSVGRRGFLKSAAAGAAALATTAPVVEAQRENNTVAAAPPTGVPAPTQEQLAREAEEFCQHLAHGLRRAPEFRIVLADKRIGPVV